MDLADRGIKGSSIRAKLAPVELLLEMNKIAFYKKIVHKTIPKDVERLGGAVAFTDEDVELMLNSTRKARTKALIHFMASTGIRPGAITDPVLRRKHLVEMPDNCYAIKVYDNSKEGYYAFLTPEASKSLNRYFDTRKLNGETLTDESPLFINEREDRKSSVSKFPDRHLTLNNLKGIMSKLMKTSCIVRTKIDSKVGVRYDKAMNYGFRKRFNTILKLNNNVNSNITEKLMAHKNGLDGTYLTPTVEECFREFAKAIPEITIADSDRNKIKIRKLESEKSELEKGRLEIEQLKKRMEDLEYGSEAREAAFAKTILKYKREKNNVGEIFSWVWHYMFEITTTEEEKRKFFKRLKNVMENGEKIGIARVFEELTASLENVNETKNQVPVSEKSNTVKEMDQVFEKVKKARESGEKTDIAWMCKALDIK